MGNLKKVNIRMPLIRPKVRIILALIAAGGAYLFFMGHYLFIIIPLLFIPFATFQVGTVYDQKGGIYRGYYAMCGMKKGTWQVLNTVRYISVKNFEFPVGMTSLPNNPTDLYTLQLACDDEQYIMIRACQSIKLALQDAAELAKLFGCEVKNESDNQEIIPVLEIVS
jgi:hypothetical protein